VDRSRIGQRVWVYGAQSYRPFGTAAERIVGPAEQAVRLPDEVSDELGACLGIPAITAHRAMFGDGPVAGQTILIQGVLGAVGSVAAQLASLGRRDGHRNGDAGGRPRRGRRRRRARSGAKPTTARAEAIRAHAPNGIHRIIKVAFSENADLDAAVAAPNGVIAAYATHRDRLDFSFWPMLFANLTIRLLGSDDFPPVAKRQAAVDLTTAAREGALSIPSGDPLPLDRIAEAHDRVDAGTRERILLAIPT
jgi:NADPH2:quinone reductase